jgi:hypothetical protein
VTGAASPIFDAPSCGALPLPAASQLLFALTWLPQTEPSPTIFVHELNSGSLQGGPDRYDGVLGNLTPFLFKVDDS